MFGLLPDAFVSLFGAVGGNYGMFLLANFLLCFLVMVPATLFMGASFPVASALVVAHFGSSGQRIGLLYAGNTIGAILGAFLAGFVLLPMLGIQTTLILTIYVNLVCGLALSLYILAKERAGKNILTPALSVSVILLLALLWQPSWDTLKMTSGPYAYAVQYQKMPIEQRIAQVRQLYYREGPIATVSVIQEGNIAMTRHIVEIGGRIAGQRGLAVQRHAGRGGDGQQLQKLATVHVHGGLLGI